MTDQDRAELIMLAKAYVALQPGSDLALADRLLEHGHSTLVELHVAPGPRNHCPLGGCLLVHLMAEGNFMPMWMWDFQMTSIEEIHASH